MLVFWGLFLSPKVKASSPTINSSEASLKNKIEIKFNRPIDRKKIKASINPEIAGSWKFEGEILNSHLFTTLSFNPDSFLTPETDYNITVNGISSFFGSNENSYSLNFRTRSIPLIISSNIQNGQADIPISSDIIFNLSQKNEGDTEFDFQFSPQISYEKIYDSQNKAYILKPKEQLGQATQYNVIARRTIFGTEDKDYQYQLDFKTKAPPAVESFFPNGSGVLIDTNQIWIKFNEEMDGDALVTNSKITPALDGKWSWDIKNKKLIFNSTNKLKYGTKYEIVIAKGVKAKANNYIENDIVLSFLTIGNVYVTSVYPKNGSSGIMPSDIKITFDQEVEHSSAEKLFYITPEASGKFSWNGNTLIFTSENISKDKNYQFGIKAGVLSTKGLPSIRDYNFSFATVASETILNVVLDYQDKALSCEAASLKMALLYRGVKVSEDDIMSIVGYDPTIRNGNVWGDPYSAFVGSINGRQNTTGYGVYWDPIAKAANNWRSASAFSDWDVAKITAEIAAGNPVVVWGVTGSSISRDDWVTPEGKQILAWRGEHARVLIGFKGTVENPTAFILNDPISGRITWTKEKFESNWSTFNNSGVIIR